MPAREISNSDDVIDSRDIIARIEELTDAEDTDEQEELSALIALAKEGADYSEDWSDGATLIRDSYFENYAQELAEEIGAIKRGEAIRWPYTFIDWTNAADELKQDYTEVDFDGVIYWVR